MNQGTSWVIKGFGRGAVALTGRGDRLSPRVYFKLIHARVVGNKVPSSGEVSRHAFCIFVGLYSELISSSAFSWCKYWNIKGLRAVWLDFCAGRVIKKYECILCYGGDPVPGLCQIRLRRVRDQSSGVCQPGFDRRGTPLLSRMWGVDIRCPLSSGFMACPWALYSLPPLRGLTWLQILLFGQIHVPERVM